MTPPRYIFTVTAGRSGQAALCALLRRHATGCYAAFEEPHAAPVLSGRLGMVEKRFRRRFIKTHELLGRGKVLAAYASRDEDFLDKIVARRLRLIEHQLSRTGCIIHFDVSKFFARGLHLAFMRAVPDAALVRLVRDPILNMRSYLNRNKNFWLDNGRPEASVNCLCLDSADLAKGELYLWAWCEMYLRYDQLIEEFGIMRHVEIRTEDLARPERIATALDRLGLAHSAIKPQALVNTNLEAGFAETIVGQEDIALFERFLDRLGPEIRDRMRYFDDYRPRSQLNISPV